MQQIAKSELKELREMLYEEQDGICPILKVEIPVEDMVVDHKHRKKSTPIGENGAGMIRGVIQRSANVVEGKLSNAYVRYGLHKFDITLPDFLRNLADYLENPPLESEFFIHPSEAPPPKKLMRSSFNKLKKEWQNDPQNKFRLFPAFPKSGKMIKALRVMYDHYEITPEYYKS